MDIFIKGKKMKLISLLLLCSCTTRAYYVVPIGKRTYMHQETIIGYKCPPGMYLDMRDMQCHADIVGAVVLNQKDIGIPTDGQVTVKKKFKKLKSCGVMR